jgi:hypothetical protein
LSGFSQFTYIFESGGPPVGRPITLRVVASDDAQRSALAQLVMSTLGQIDGVKDIERDDKPGKEQIKVDLDDAKRLNHFARKRVEIIARLPAVEVSRRSTIRERPSAVMGSIMCR